MSGGNCDDLSCPRVAAAASRRAVLRGLTSAASALALCGCAGVAAGPRFDASALVLNPTLLVASTRKPVNGARAKPVSDVHHISVQQIAVALRDRSGARGVEEVGLL